MRDGHDRAAQSSEAQPADEFDLRRAGVRYTQNDRVVFIKSRQIERFFNIRRFVYNDELGLKECSQNISGYG
ncbi:hypothetical protein ACMS1Z_10970 [Acidiphilium multivorum]|uniref:hypothetical protein n=1 Tax=Acidiphilium multivorum TaxID=62140 RepID=UPI0039C9AEA6